ncbi:MAG: CHASE2 domain-containing protein [Alphaproteobacteria bacterium]|nr:CHASE2 domain-containing protein [Alphaproteobacteria bacterium]
MNQGLLARLAKLMRGSVFASTVVLLLVAVPMALLLIVAVAKLSPLAYLDGFVRDLVVKRATPAEPQDPQIVVVAIDETTLDPFRYTDSALGQSQYHYRDPIDRQALGDLLTAIAGKHPAAIGVDVRLDRPTEDEKDSALRHTMRTLSASVPIVTAYTEKGLSDKQLESLYSYSVLQSRAFSDLREDPNTRTVRGIEPGQVAGHDGRDYPSFVRLLATNVGINTPAKPLDLVWRGPPANSPYSFAQYPAQYVALLPASWFANKIVLVGEDLSRIDRKVTPFGTAPDVVVQANALSQLLRYQHLHRIPSPTLPWWPNFLITLALALAGARDGALNWPLTLRAATGLAGIAILWLVGATIFHFQGVLIGLVSPTLAAVASFTVMDSLTGREARKERQFIHSAFSSYVSPKLVERLMRDPDRMSFDGERRTMTYLFTDVKDFSTMSEGLDSKELPVILNTYLEGMTQIVLKHDGMVDKFIGDSVFAIFNAPVDLPQHADLAVKCALDLDDFCENFRKEQNAAGVPFGLTRIGVHTGNAVIGNFGSRARFTYTAQGDAVNTASRLEALNKHLGTRICVSGSTTELCNGLAFRPIASVVVKGKTIAVEVCQPLRDGEYSKDYLDRYAAAYRKLCEGSAEAQPLFQALAAERPDDPCVALHLKRLASGERTNRIVMEEK